jgi:hypothetical protein
MAVTQPSASNLAVTVQQAIASSVATLTRIDTAQLPVGTLLQGKVLTSRRCRRCLANQRCFARW